MRLRAVFGDSTSSFAITPIAACAIKSLPSCPLALAVKTTIKQAAVIETEWHLIVEQRLQSAMVQFKYSFSGIPYYLESSISNKPKKKTLFQNWE